MSMVMTSDLDSAVEAYASLDAHALADRWSLYARLRREAPVYRYGHTVLVTRYSDISDILADPVTFTNGGEGRDSLTPEVLRRLSSRERTMIAEIDDYHSHWLAAVDGQRHTELRAIGQRVFSPRALRNLEPRIQEIVDELLAAVEGRAQIEFVHDFAYRLPLTVICDILDVPDDLRGPLHETWLGMLPARTGLAWRNQLPLGLESANAKYHEFNRMLGELLDIRRGRPTTEIMSNLLAAEADPSVDDRDVIGLMMILFAAGHQTTADLLGSGLHALLTDRPQWELLCAEPDLVTNAVEEVLRYRSPSQDIAQRVVAVPTTVAGVPLDPGQHVTAVLGSANRDESVFEAPEVFDIRRTDANKHMAFGKGVHFCLGSPLSKMETKLALTAFAARYPDCELVDPEPAWMPNTHFLGLTEMQLVLDPARR